MELKKLLILKICIEFDYTFEDIRCIAYELHFPLYKPGFRLNFIAKCLLFFKFIYGWHMNKVFTLYIYISVSLCGKLTSKLT